MLDLALCKPHLKPLPFGRAIIAHRVRTVFLEIVHCDRKQEMRHLKDYICARTNMPAVGVVRYIVVHGGAARPLHSCMLNPESGSTLKLQPEPPHHRLVRPSIGRYSSDTE